MFLDVDIYIFKIIRYFSTHILYICHKLMSRYSQLYKDNQFFAEETSVLLRVNPVT